MTGFPIILALIAMVGPASTRPVDFQTVETLQIAYHDAVRASDATSIAGMYAAETKWERQVRDVLVRNDLAANRLRKAVEAELGVKLVGGGQYMAQDVSEWQVGQDSATVEGLNAQRAYPPLKKTKAGWKIDPFSWGIGWLVPPEKAGKDSPNQREMMAMLSREKWLDRVTARVQEGTYWRLEDVVKASSVGHVLDEMKGAATKPVRRPVTRPVKVDLSTPLAAYDTLAKALIQGDIAAMRQALAPNRSETPAQRESEERWLRTSCALHVAAVERFGAQGWKVGLQNGMEPHQVGMDLLTELDIAAAED